MGDKGGSSQNMTMCEKRGQRETRAGGYTQIRKTCDKERGGGLQNRRT